MRNILVVGFLIMSLFQHCLSEAPSNRGSKEIDHEQWNALLQKHVDEIGNVDYLGFQRDSISLNIYLELLVANAPDPSTWSTDAQLAYWINLYNAFTVKLIIAHYPLESIKDIGSKIQVPFINSPWDIKLININAEKLDLNNVEHSILRKQFDEPRIHFAINCASFSCPKIRREAYVAGKLDEQLEEQAIEYINDPKRNELSKHSIKLSKIFDWFKGDFTKTGSLIDFVNRYSEIEINEKAKISYLKYDWSLNER